MSIPTVVIVITWITADTTNESHQWVNPLQLEYVQRYYLEEL